MTTEQTAGMQTVPTRGGRLRVARSRGALSGLLLVLLGAWGAIVPFIGSYFSFAYTPDNTWTWTAERGWLDVLPGCVVLVAGLVMLVSANRLTAGVAAWFAVAGGAWFVVGPQLASFAGIGVLGTPTASSAGMRALEAIAYFYGLGVVIVFLAASALGRLSVYGVADVRAAEQRAAAAEPVATAEPVAAAEPEATAGPVPSAEPTEDAVARENARQAIAQERDGHAHRHFLRGRRSGRTDETVSAGGDRTPR